MRRVLSNQIEGPDPRDAMHGRRHDLRLTPFDVAVGMPFGHVEDGSSGDPVSSPQAALRHVLLGALLRPPCVVAFSGGVDSSLLLILLSRLAREEGLAQPLVATHQFRGLVDAEEGQWQRLALEAAGSPEVTVLDGFPDADLLGHRAQAQLRRHGLLYPAMLPRHGALLELAAGGTLVSGEGGDEVLGPTRSGRVTEVWHRRKPRRVALRRAASAMLPGPAQRRLGLRAAGDALPSWLTPPSQAAARAALSAERALEPFHAGRSTRRLLHRRAHLISTSSCALVAAEYQTINLMPFLEPSFVHATAKAKGVFGWPSRMHLVDALFPGVLPTPLLTRTTKARFNGAFFGAEVREFARDWGGGGVDTALVEPEALRRTWLSERPHAASAMLLHQAWLHSIRA
jgi:hypothetical protein